MGPAAQELRFCFNAYAKQKTNWVKHGCTLDVGSVIGKWMFQSTEGQSNFDAGDLVAEKPLEGFPFFPEK